MRRVVDSSSTSRTTASRRADANVGLRYLSAAIRVASLLVIPAAIAVAGDGDGPALTPPAEMPVVAKPASTPPATTIAPATTAPTARGVLALPGLTTPAARIRSTPASASPSLDSAPGELSLDAPIEMRSVPDPVRTNPSTASGRSSRPLVLESTPDDAPVPISGLNNRVTPPTGRTLNSKVEAQPVPTPARRPRLFGFLPNPTPPPAAVSAAPKVSIPGRSVVGDVREEPTPDSDLKKRIERQAREAAGDRARWIEVRLVGKNAVVQAHGVKFYQKRGVRKSLEGLPALTGLRSTIEIAD